MLTSIDKITYCNGFMLNGQPASKADVAPIFEGRLVAAMSIWEQYEQKKTELRKLNLSPDDYQSACRQIAEALGI
ncbi:TPA: hypothetical protein ACIU15_003841 [Yersinia enterocolitica]|nr:MULTISPECIES: hypothetical protein [Yersinia]EKN4720287.1 hypothetical protein [Yersinia enterocolitica]EKN4732395.1 hypothetical protein [Yersinia enterocolitica]WET16967.1 hypothetical protein P2W49_11575 [Yersinia intermedia]CNH56587.1 Uncharacterised protein [Yersinia intermedia]CNK18501.1 Uncharacterised protein [Yersinia intermedia]